MNEPLVDVSATPEVAALAKADLHLHQEVFPRLERIVAHRQGREPYAWQAWARHVMTTVPAGPGRLQAIYRPDHTLGVDRSLDNDPELFITRVADILSEAAADGAIYIEVRFGADRAASAGLGVTVHVGVFATTSIAAALRTPGLRRIGHGTHIADDPYLLDDLARSGVTVECALTCNVVLGSAPAYEAHPIRKFVQHGIPVTLATDLPMHVCTTIGREYAIASRLGFSPDDLLAFTRNAVAASFTASTRRAALLAELRSGQGTH